MAYRYHHLHLICSDLNKMENFFTKDLGAKLVERRKFGTADGATLDLNGVLINLRKSREGDNIAGDSAKERYGYDHLGLQVDNLDAAYKDLQSKGYTFITPPTESGKMKIAFFKGPDNITIELLQAAG
jgi:catechol 2,3-dioxygenase-like lactoylglutathione lyase family enzyme